MYVKVDTIGGTVQLEDAANFQQFHVEAPAGATTAEVVDTLGAGGRAHSDDHVWISVAAVRRWAAPSAGDGWNDGFEAMLSYAASKGWTDEDGAHIQAHIERA